MSSRNRLLVNLLFGRWPQSSQPPDVIDPIFHPSVRNRKHKQFFLLSQHPDSSLNLCHFEGHQVTIKIFEIKILRWIGPILFSPNVGAHLEDIHVNFGVNLIFWCWSAWHRIHSQYPLLSAVFIIHSLVYSDQVLYLVGPRTVVNVVSLVQRFDVLFQLYFSWIFSIEFWLNLGNHFILLICSPQV